MSNTTTATTAVKPKQFTFGVSEKMKLELTELRKEFNRPAAVKNAEPVDMTEKEVLEVLFTVATDRRFKTVEVMESVEIDGETVEVQAIDDDGNLKFETLDLFQDQWEVIKGRDYSDSAASLNTTDKIIASLRKVGKALNLSEATLQTMIDNALAARGEAAETPATTPPPLPQEAGEVPA